MESPTFAASQTAPSFPGRDKPIPGQARPSRLPCRRHSLLHNLLHNLLPALLPTLFLASLLLGSCSRGMDRVAYLYTDIPLLVSYLELFNSQNPESPLLPHYLESPRDWSPEDSTRTPSLIIARGINHEGRDRNYRNLSGLLEEDGIPAQAFYPALLNSGARENRQYLLPVSFNLPIVLGLTDSFQDIPGLFLDLVSLESRSQAYTTAPGSRNLRMGFSPLWNQGFVLDHSRLSGASFVQVEGNLSWNSQALLEGISRLGSWITESHRGREHEISFTNQYVYGPHYRLMASGRILFSYSTLRDFYLLPEDIRLPLEYRYPSLEERIPVQDDVVWLGIPRNAPGRASAEAFIKWFFRPETQAALLERTANTRIGSFGIAGGLSSLMEVNQNRLGAVQPQLIGRIPPSSFLLFPESLPRNWPQIRDEVILPWMRRRILGEEDRPLEQPLEEFLLQQTR